MHNVTSDVTTARYHSLSILLHWLVALGLLFMFASGLYMVNADISKAEQYKLFQIHKASGVLMLWAIIARIAVRAFTQAPPMIKGLTKTANKGAKFGHLLLYIGLVVMVLSGWFMVSASPFGLPTLVFVDWINWPHIPYVARNKSIEGIANNIHWIAATALACLTLGHIGAVIWHKKKHKLNLLTRMWWSKT